MFTVCILRSKVDGRYYYGQTSDLTKRLTEDNLGLSGYTSKYKPWALIYCEEFQTRSEALKREKYFKSTSGRRFLQAKNIISKLPETNHPEMED